ncbi:hypothetical protein DQG13_04210 [Paenibacillus sp. YN15]|nr:hypothetical protein DQG13_04210 [Paenibacillus sp. YN15]
MREMGYQLATGILYFVCYAFAGWILESAYASLREKRFVNRGFLHGGYCPIYGAGALIIIAVSNWTLSLAVSAAVRYLLLFLLSMALVSLLEYLTGAALQKLFHRRWWDYSGNRMNLGGHICLFYSLLWGALALVFAVLIHPPVANALRLLPGNLTAGAAVIASVYLLADSCYSLRKHVKEACSAFLADAAPVKIPWLRF